MVSRALLYKILVYVRERKNLAATEAVTASTFIRDIALCFCMGKLQKCVEE